jgi:hypothetical protein
MEEEKPVLEIEAIKRLRLRPGDIIVLRCPGRMRKEGMDYLRKSMEFNFPDHKCLVLEEGMDIETITKEEEK